jgi:hypothetical protein
MSNETKQNTVINTRRTVIDGTDNHRNAKPKQRIEEYQPYSISNYVQKLTNGIFRWEFHLISVDISKECVEDWI